MSPTIDPSPPSLRERKQIQTTDAILQSALQLIAEQGFEATTVDQICDRAQVARATFFNYFAQKELLISEIGRRRLGRIRDWFATRSGAGSSLRRAELIAVFEEFSQENIRLGPNMRSLVSAVMVRTAADPELQALYREMSRHMIEVMESLQAAGEAQIDIEPELLAAGFWNLYVGGTVSALGMGADLESVPVTIAALQEVFLRGPQDA